jgi:hypothetical protein
MHVFFVPGLSLLFFNFFKTRLLQNLDLSAQMAQFHVHLLRVYLNHDSQVWPTPLQLMAAVCKVY